MNGLKMRWAGRAALAWSVAGGGVVMGGAPASAACPEVPGDVNDSGATDVVDVQCAIISLLWSLAGQVADPPTCLVGGLDTLDIDCNGAAEISDVQLVIVISLGMPLPEVIDTDGSGCPDACEGADATALVWFGAERFFNGPLSVQPPGPIWASQGLEVWAETYPASAGHAVTLYWRAAGGDGPFEAAPLTLESSQAGEFQNNGLWRGALSASQLAGLGQLEVYFEADDGQAEPQYISNFGNNFSFDVEDPDAPAAIQFVGDRTFATANLARAQGDPAYAGLDFTVTVQTWPPSLDHEVTLYYTVDGQQTIVAAPMAFGRAGAGAFGNNFEWITTIDAASLPPGATLELWMSATDGATTLWDSNEGQNYAFPIEDPSDAIQPTFARAGAFTFAKCHWDGSSCQAGWQYAPGVANPLEASYSQYQVYGAWRHPAVELYVPGVSDGDPNDPFVQLVATQLLRVRVSTPLFGGDPLGPASTAPLSLNGKYGNNYVFQWVFFTTGCTCPAGFDWPALGTYPYTYELSLDGGASWSAISLDEPDAETLPLAIDWQMLPPGGQ